MLSSGLVLILSYNHYVVSSSSVLLLGSDSWLGYLLVVFLYYYTVVLVVYGAGLLSSTTPQCYLLLQMLAYSFLYGIQVCGSFGRLLFWVTMSVDLCNGGYVGYSGLTLVMVLCASRCGTLFSSSLYSSLCW